MQIETVAVVSSALVAITGVVVPSLGKSGDRRHELRMLFESKHAESRATWWERRELIYFDALKVAVQLRNVIEFVEQNAISGNRVASAIPNEVADLTARMDTYGSPASSEQMQTVIGPMLRFIEAHLRHGTLDQRPQDVLAETRISYPVLAKTMRDELAAGPPPV